MSELPVKPLERIFDALGPWPIVQFAAAALIVYFVLKAMGRGEKDRKSVADTTPRWFANEQTLDLLRDISGLLRDIKAELARQSDHLHHHSSVLENIANENMINPRRLQE